MLTLGIMNNVQKTLFNVKRDRNLLNRATEKDFSQPGELRRKIAIEKKYF